MDQHNNNNNRNDFLRELLANPANDAHAYTADLQQLVNDNPQSGILQALLAHASEEKNLKRASAYFNSRALYKLINSPAGFARVPDENIILRTNIPESGYHNLLPVTENEAAYPEEDNDTENYFNDHTVVETEEHAGQHQFSAAHETEQPIVDEHHLLESVPEVEGYIEESTESKIPAENKVTSPEEIVQSNKVLASDNNDKSDEVEPVADVFVHDEPVTEEGAVEEPNDDVPSNTILAHDGQVTDNIVTGDNQPVEIENENPTEAVSHIDNATQPEPSADEDEIYDEITGIEDIHIKPTAFAGSSLALEKEFDEYQQVESHAETASIENTFNQEENVSAGDAGQSDVSVYHDEKMPYTFMWWLDKTRKDHSGVYQPYAKSEVNTSNHKVKTNTNELQQQYYENIFHITSVDELDKSTTHRFAPVNIKRKEQVIIERFIKEEPQIKPQSSDKLDNENKAKKSSEDGDELITETLAVIYTDQMLYHKAIAAYQKLMLKFPEKSRYFADKIEQLEKKTN